MKIIGYGICGEGEADRYMRDTLDCFKRLCDEVIILCNNSGKAEQRLIEEYGFKWISDRRQWGSHQWRIKQDFMQRDIAPIAEAGDILLCLDMDETIDKRLTREWLLEAPLDAYHVFVVDLWNDPEHYKPESCFWNVRIWRWNGDVKFKEKPVHCGLAPEWTYKYHRHAPFLLLHKGLMLEEDRERKIKRYERFDPKAEYLDRKYYDMLKESDARPFDEEALHDVIEKEVATYKQTKPREPMANSKPKERFAYVKNPNGVTLDIPERHLKETVARKGFEFVGWADEAQAEIEEMFEDVELEPGDTSADEPLLPRDQGAYQRSTEAIKRQEERTDEESLIGKGTPAILPEAEAEELFEDGPDESAPDSPLDPDEAAALTQSAPPEEPQPPQQPKAGTTKKKKK